MRRRPLFLVSLLGAIFFFYCSLAQSDSPNPRIVMLGDSITAWVDWTSLLNRTNVWNQGVAGDRTGDVLKRMEKVYRIKPKYCFLMIGINDILNGLPVEAAFGNYRKIVDDLTTRGIIPVIQSTLYLAESDGRNDLVESLNRKLKNLAEERKILFLDLNRRLAPQGQLLRVYTYDGLHLNTTGYMAWRDELIKHSAILQ
jgi:lysophospholipase L1-like esterase